MKYETALVAKRTGRQMAHGWALLVALVATAWVVAQQGNRAMSEPPAPESGASPAINPFGEAPDPFAPVVQPFGTKPKKTPFGNPAGNDPFGAAVPPVPAASAADPFGPPPSAATTAKKQLAQAADSPSGGNAESGENNAEQGLSEEPEQRRTAAGSETDRNESKPTRNIAQELRAVTQFDFIETPLDQVIAFLKDYHDIEIMLDRAGLEEAGVAADQPITRSFKGVRLATVLDLVLPAHGLSYMIHDDVLVITTEERAKTIQIYPLTGKLAENVSELTTILPELFDSGSRSVRTLPEMQGAYSGTLPGMMPAMGPEPRSTRIAGEWRRQRRQFRSSHYKTSSSSGLLRRCTGKSPSC